MLHELGWQKLEERRHCNRLTMIHKIRLSQAPSYLINMLPAQRAQTTGRALRNANAFSEIFAASETFKSSFFPLSISQYNALDPEISSSPSVTVFKQKIGNQYNRPPPWFYYGERKYSVIHSKLRMQCSSLNGHLFNLSVIDCSMCACGSPFEDNSHFFLKCPMYNAERNKMVQNLNLLGIKMDLNLLLYGNPHLNKDFNFKIVHIVHDFINDSHRFLF